MELIHASTTSAFGTQLAAAVSGNIDSIFPVAVIAVGITVAFYVLGRIIGLFPSGRSRKS